MIDKIKEKDVGKDKERKPKRVGEKENRKYLHFFFDPSDHYSI